VLLYDDRIDLLPFLL
jgi:MFS transporter, FLVCR family, MFS-domain-containing protein 7